jgi:hypothetical protein
VSLDARSGTQRWAVQVGENPMGHAITAAPLVVEDKIIGFTSITLMFSTPVPRSRASVSLARMTTGLITEGRWRRRSDPAGCPSIDQESARQTLVSLRAQEKRRRVLSPHEDPLC